VKSGLPGFGLSVEEAGFFVVKSNVHSVLNAKSETNRLADGALRETRRRAYNWRDGS
jgi:hypothetical protein